MTKDEEAIALRVAKEQGWYADFADPTDEEIVTFASRFLDAIRESQEPSHYQYRYPEGISNTLRSGTPPMEIIPLYATPYEPAVAQPEPVVWKVWIDSGVVWFSKGVQKFCLHYDGYDEIALKWMKSQLEKALTTPTIPAHLALVPREITPEIMRALTDVGYEGNEVAMIGDYGVIIAAGEVKL